MKVEPNLGPQINESFIYIITELFIIMKYMCFKFGFHMVCMLENILENKPRSLVQNVEMFITSYVSENNN